MSQKMAVRCPLIIDFMIASRTVVHNDDANVPDDSHSEVADEVNEVNEVNEVDDEAEEADELPSSER